MHFWQLIFCEQKTLIHIGVKSAAKRPKKRTFGVILMVQNRFLRGKKILVFRYLSQAGIYNSRQDWQLAKETVMSNTKTTTSPLTACKVVVK